MRTNTTTNILGTEYTIAFVNNEDEAKKYPNLDLMVDGVCSSDCKMIVIRAYDRDFKESSNDMIQTSLNTYINRCLRHEIIHAYFNECGLRSQCSVCCIPWSRNEAMVDWFAIMLPKIFNTFKELNILDN